MTLYGWKGNATEQMFEDSTTLPLRKVRGRESGARPGPEPGSCSTFRDGEGAITSRMRVCHNRRQALALDSRMNDQYLAWKVRFLGKRV